MKNYTLKNAALPYTLTMQTTIEKYVKIVLLIIIAENTAKRTIYAKLAEVENEQESNAYNIHQIRILTFWGARSRHISSHCPEIRRDGVWTISSIQSIYALLSE
jgi:hypothetical protein